MNIRQASLFLSAALFIASCSSGPAPVVDTQLDAATEVERSVKEVTIRSGEPVTTADLRIEGMSCAMMCGSSIRKALAKLPGVSSAEVDYQEGDAPDHATVVFDEKRLNENDLIEAVHGLHGGQYRVMAISITRQVKATGGSGDVQESTSEERGVSVYAPAAALLPSVITVLTRILRP